MNALREALLRGRRRPRIHGGGSPVNARGDGYEFVELREYQSGDDVRRIDWAASARTGALQTRVVLEDVALTMAAMLDDSDSMRVGRTRPLLDAAREAERAWFGAASGEDRKLHVFSGEVRRAPARSARAFDVQQAFDAALAVLPKGSALLIVGDFWEIDAHTQRVLRMGARFDCTALCARDPWRGDLPLRGFVRMRDAERASSSVVYLGERERARYADAVVEREADLERRLASANWRVGWFDGDEDGGTALMRAFGLR